MADALRRLSALASQMRRGSAEPDFFELVRRMDWQHPALPRTGCAAHLSQEPLRFAQAPYLKFPETTIAAIAPSIPEAPGTARITLYAFGLWGVNGPMPLELTSWVFQRAHNHFDFTAQAFADIIHHRFISLYVRAWAQNEEAAQHDRPADDLTGAAVCALAGDPTGAASRESAGRLGGEEPMPEGVLPAGLSRSFSAACREAATASKSCLPHGPTSLCACALPGRKLSTYRSATAPSLAVNRYAGSGGMRKSVGAPIPRAAALKLRSDPCASSGRFR